MGASFYLVVTFCVFASALPGTVKDEPAQNPGYFLFQSPDGSIQLENLTQPVEEVFATEDTITFYASTRQNRYGARINESDIRDIPRISGWNNRQDTLVVIHGWTNDHTSAVNDKIKTAALTAHDINVLVVDWSPIASKNYVIAQRAVLRVGNYIGAFLSRMEKDLGLDFDRVTVVGHSLGAHISGNIGSFTGGRVNKIVGLDPAGPLFTESNIDNRLDPTDARFVQVIHTNDGRLGFDIIMGHADYYPNGGRSQPGCGWDITGSCAHSRAYAYFAESLNNNNFWARVCGSQTDYNLWRCFRNTASQMGGLPASQVQGKLYLTTNSASPYARGFL